MGITCMLRRVTERDLDRLLAGELDLGAMLSGPAPPPQPGGLRGFVSWLWKASAEPGPAIAPPPPEPEREDELDLDKAWHGLHFLFTGLAEGGAAPGCFLLEGGEEIEEAGDDGPELDSPARAFRPAEVRAIADFLDRLPPAELARRYDPAAMTRLRLYPDVIWTRPPRPGEELSPLEYLLDYAARLRGFVSQAAARGDGLLVWQG
ncbi:YfbM family protein [Falsiroseomonas sp. HW251]|uniref:YfbM family protein n=1 Tax=Falsiroseomonas sp. HW251 TaxID=3390998 RepID=UPI003D320ABA